MVGGSHVELSPAEMAALLLIADRGSDVGDLSEDDLTGLQGHALIEQRGPSFGLTAVGMRMVAWIKSTSRHPVPYKH